MGMTIDKAKSVINELKLYVEDLHSYSADDVSETLEFVIKALEQTRWIPVSEKPQEGRYLCTYEHYDGKCIDFGSFDGEVWYIKPIAYMPLPKPYKAESEE